MSVDFRSALFVSEWLRLLPSTGDWVLVLENGQIIHAQGENKIALLGLAQTAANIQKYLSLKPGQLGISNDVGCGANSLSDVALVTCLNAYFKDTTKILLATLAPMVPKITRSEKIDDEGVRIPPMPIGTIAEPNFAMLSAIEMAPNSSPLWKSTYQRRLIALRQTAQLLQNWMQMSGTYSSTPSGRSSSPTTISLNDYMKFAFAQAGTILRNLSLGHVTETALTSRGQALKLQIKNDESGISLDFTGTDSTMIGGLAETAVLGLGFICVCRSLGTQLPLNSESLKYFQLRTPTPSLVHPSANTARVQGLLATRFDLEDILMSALTKLKRGTLGAPSARPSPLVEIDFGGGGRIVLLAQDENPWNVGIASALNCISIEQLESEMPVRVLRTGAESAKINSIEVELLANATVTAMDFTTSPAKRFSISTPDQQKRSAAADTSLFTDGKFSQLAVKGSKVYVSNQI